MIYNLSQEEQLKDTKSIAMLDYKISVIVPCYNAQAYIVRCVESILHQTIGRKHLEIVLVNDASTDDTYSVLLELEQQYPEQILVINCTENGRQGRARNIGLSYCTGEYITFVDADDIIAPVMLEQLVLGIIKCGVQIAECDIVTFTDASKIPVIDLSDDSIVRQMTLVENEQEANIFFINNAFETSVCRRLYCREFIIDAQLSFPEKIYMEDLYFSQLAMIYCKSIYKIHLPLYFYYTNPDSTMNSDKLSGYYMDVHNVSAMVIEELKQRGLFEQYKDALKLVYEKKVFEDLTEYMHHNFNVFPEKNYQIMKDYMQQTFA